MADGVRFELTEGVNLDGFQDRCIQPLCHPSAENGAIIYDNRIQWKTNFN